MTHGGCAKRPGRERLGAPVAVAIAARSIHVEAVAAVVHVKVEDVKELLLAQRSPTVRGTRAPIRSLDGEDWLLLYHVSPAPNPHRRANELGEFSEHTGSH